MKEPCIYAEWVSCFDAFAAGNNDEAVLQLMELGSIEWTTGIDEKMTRRLYELLELRLKQVSSKMDAEFGRNGQSDTEIVRTLLNARRRFALLQRLVSLKAFPEEVKDTLKQTLHSYVRDTQASLEKSAESDRTGHIRFLIRNNSLNRYEEEATGHPCSEMEKSSAQPVRKNTRRRVLW